MRVLFFLKILICIFFEYFNENISIFIIEVFALKNQFRYRQRYRDSDREFGRLETKIENDRFELYRIQYISADEVSLIADRWSMPSRQIRLLRTNK